MTSYHTPIHPKSDMHDVVREFSLVREEVHNLLCRVHGMEQRSNSLNIDELEQRIVLLSDEVRMLAASVDKLLRARP